MAGVSTSLANCSDGICVMRNKQRLGLEGDQEMYLETRSSMLELKMSKNNCWKVTNSEYQIHEEELLSG